MEERNGIKFSHDFQHYLKFVFCHYIMNVILQDKSSMGMREWLLVGFKERFTDGWLLVSL